MKKEIYIQADANTANLVELLLLKIDGLESLVSRLFPSNSVQLFSESEAATILHISKRTLVDLRNKQKISYHKIESRILYSVEDIRDFEGRCRQP